MLLLDNRLFRYLFFNFLTWIQYICRKSDIDGSIPIFYVVPIVFTQFARKINEN